MGLENAHKTGGWCIQLIVAGGMSEMQIAEESMARSEGVPVMKVHMDKEPVDYFDIEPNMGLILCARERRVVVNGRVFLCDEM